MKITTTAGDGGVEIDFEATTAQTLRRLLALLQAAAECCLPEAGGRAVRPDGATARVARFLRAAPRGMPVLVLSLARLARRDARHAPAGSRALRDRRIARHDPPGQ